jgi:hypothetical protein
MGKYKKVILLLTILSGLIACSPTQRFSRLVTKYPYLLQKDTITQIDTLLIQVPEVKVDSIIQIDSFIVDLHDTIIIEKERLKIELYRVNDSIIINGNCDTIYIDKIIERKIPVKVYVKPSKQMSLKNWALLFVGLIILLLLLIVVIKFLQLLK